MIMITYEEFNVPQVYYDECLKQHRILFINDYYKKHNVYPTEDIINNVALSEEKRERIKRLKYAEYLASGNISQEPNTPVIPPMEDEVTPNNDEWFVMTYNVTTILEPTQLFNSKSLDSIGTMQIDGNIVEPCYEYVFNTIGIHKVKVLLKDTSRSGNFKFNYISQLKELVIPTSINELEQHFLYRCGGIEKIYSLALNAPKIYKYGGVGPTFDEINKYGILYVYADSMGYNSWVSTGGTGTTTLKDFEWTMDYINGK